MPWGLGHRTFPPWERRGKPGSPLRQAEAARGSGALSAAPEGPGRVDEKAVGPLAWVHALPPVLVGFLALEDPPQEGCVVFRVGYAGRVSGLNPPKVLRRPLGRVALS